MRRAKLEGRRIGRAPLDIDREQVVHDRSSGMSLTQVATKYRISRASVVRLVKESGGRKKTSLPRVGNRGFSADSAKVGAGRAHRFNGWDV